MENVKSEAIHNIKRLRNHACLALWCGNNEVEMGIKFWDWKEKFNYSDEQFKQLKSDYRKLFHYLLPELVTKHDPAHFYFASSPIGFWETKEDDNKGDNHYWGVWHGEEDFEAYRERVPRFMSEFGFQSFPLQQSVDKFVDKKDQYIDSEAMKVHQKHPRGNRIISETILKYYKQPSNFKSFLYLSQLLQAEGLKVAFEAHRGAKPFCMGTLYWQLNDCWPVASWSGIDYYGKWKALHYQAKKSFAKYLVLTCDEGKKSTTKVISDSLSDDQATIKTEWLSFSGEVLKSTITEVLLASNAVTVVTSEEIADFPEEAFCCVKTLLISGKQESRDISYRKKVKDIQFEKPKIKCNHSQTGNVVTLTVTATNFVKNLHIYFEGAEGNFSDNFFDLIPNESKVIHYELQEGERFTSLSYSSVFDTY